MSTFYPSACDIFVYVGKRSSTANHDKALQFHPDKNDHPDAEEVFKKVAEAYEVLSDSKSHTMIKCVQKITMLVDSIAEASV